MTRVEYLNQFPMKIKTEEIFTSFGRFIPEPIFDIKFKLRKVKYEGFVDEEAIARFLKAFKPYNEAPKYKFISWKEEK